jgi:glutamate---cysteine ligase / carboxylate-amine ligase
MAKFDFKVNDRPTVGIEVELGLIDHETLALVSRIEEVLARLPAESRGSVKPELMQCYVEVNSGICETIGEAEVDLKGKLLTLQHACDGLGIDLLWTATHPFSSWKDQQVTNDARYRGLLEMLQEMARRLVTFGLHVHIGVDSGDKAVMICDRILQHLPTLLAVSSNSPLWDNRVTGLQSYRSKTMEGLPTAGLPPLMRNWSEYTWLVNHMIDTGFISTIREIWWDVRPHHNFGTVEVRVCDMPGNLEDVLAIAALIQCLVTELSRLIDEGTYQHDCHPILVRQNKWRASRFGNRAQLVNSHSYESQSVSLVVNELVERLLDTAEKLDCVSYLEHVRQLGSRISWADRQLTALEESGDPREVVREMLRHSRIEP